MDSHLTRPEDLRRTGSNVGWQRRWSLPRDRSALAVVAALVTMAAAAIAFAWLVPL